MATERQRQVVLGVLLVVLAVVLYRAVTSQGETSPPSSTSRPSTATSNRSTSSSNGRARTSKSAPGSESTTTAPDVHLRALDDERPKPIAGDRNLFRFRPKPAPPPPPPPPPVVRDIPSVASGPPPPPPIPLKFIGIAEAPMQSKRIAALVDPTGRSFHGREGEIVAGQYRILKIGVESIEMAYLDGRGRQTIRLSGS
jgi:hypothetical protein